MSYTHIVLKGTSKVQPPWCGDCVCEPIVRITEETAAVWLEELAPYLSPKLRTLNVSPEAKCQLVLTALSFLHPLHIAFNFLL